MLIYTVARPELRAMISSKTFEYGTRMGLNAKYDIESFDRVSKNRKSPVRFSAGNRQALKELLVRYHNIFATNPIDKLYAYSGCQISRMYHI
jgi:hypothetical protein